DYRRRNLISDRKGEHRRMARTGADGTAKLFSDPRDELPIIEETEMLHPGESGNDLQTLSQGFVEEIGGGYSVDADSVDARFAHERKVLGDTGRLRVVESVTRLERPVRDASDPEFLTSLEEELGARAGSLW